MTTAFSALMKPASSTPLIEPLRKELSPEALEKRRRVGSLFRRLSKKTLSQMHEQKTQNITATAAMSSPCDAPESLQPPISLGDKNVDSKRGKPGLLETLSPLAEEKAAGPDPQTNSAQEGAEGCHPLTHNTVLQRKKSSGPARESFEIEEAS